MYYLGIVMATLAAMLWASTYFIIQRLISGGVSALGLVGMQAVIISAITLPYVFSADGLAQIKSRWVLIALAAVITLLAQALTFSAVRTTGTINTSLLTITQPIWIALAILIQGGDVSAKTAIGGTFILMGAAVIVLDGTAA